jgi:hypothetical protein
MLKIGQTFWRNHSGGHGVTNRTIRFVVVMTIGKTAAPKIRLKLAETLL